MPPSIGNRNGDGLSTSSGIESSGKSKDESNNKMSRWDGKQRKDQDNIRNQHELENGKQNEFFSSPGASKKPTGSWTSPLKKMSDSTPTDENRRSGEWIGGSPSMGPNSKVRRSWTIKQEITSPDLDSEEKTNENPSTGPLGEEKEPNTSDENNDADSADTTTKTEKSKPRLSFVEDLVSHVEEIPHHESLTPEEHAKLWYDSKEVEKIHKECAETVRKMHAGEPLVEDDPESTTRGLEYMTPNGFDIQSSSLEVVQAVLEEQARQKEEAKEQGDDKNWTLDDELLADVAEGVSRHRSRIAHLAAMKDERAIAFERQKLENSSTWGSSNADSGSDNGDEVNVWSKTGDAGKNSGSVWDQKGESGESGGSVWDKPGVADLGAPLDARVVSQGVTKSNSFGPTYVPIRRGPPDRRSLRNSNSFGETSVRARRNSNGEGREGSKSPGRIRRRQRSQRLTASAIAASVEQAASTECDSHPIATSDDSSSSAVPRASLRRSRRRTRGSTSGEGGDDTSPHREGGGSSMSPQRTPSNNNNGLPPISPSNSNNGLPPISPSNSSNTLPPLSPSQLQSPVPLLARRSGCISMTTPISGGSLSRPRVRRTGSGTVSAISLAAAVADTPSYEPSEPVSVT